MTSTAQLKLKVGHKTSAVEAKAFWLKHNQVVGRDVKVLQNTSRNGCRFLSVCYTAPSKGWKKETAGCRAHIHVIGKTEDDCTVKSLDLQHTCNQLDVKRKRNSLLNHHLY